MLTKYFIYKKFTSSIVLFRNSKWFKHFFSLWYQQQPQFYISYFPFPAHCTENCMKNTQKNFHISIICFIFMLLPIRFKNMRKNCFLPEILCGKNMICIFRMWKYLVKLVLVVWWAVSWSYEMIDFYTRRLHFYWLFMLPNF